MGPFPHDAPATGITEDNPAGLDGFEFVEFAGPDPEAIREQFRRMGYAHVATHRLNGAQLWQQGDVSYLLGLAEGSHAMRFAGEHGPCAPAMGWRTADARAAFDHAVARGAEPASEGLTMDRPAIRGIGGSLIYFVDGHREGSVYNDEFDWHAKAHPEGVGFHYLDHLTHNVFRGNMDRWFEFYGRLFNFREIRFFDIQGRHTGLISRALTSPCGRIRIPINEDRGETGQIVEYLRRYKGEGIQHIAVGTDDIYGSVAAIAERGLTFMPPPPPAYYPMSRDRVPGHEEPLDRMAEHGILIDGEGTTTGPDGTRDTSILLQIFSKTMIGPIFFEFIQRKGDDGFGEGNFQALFEAIERDQIERGVLEAG
ncbi:4-hydroxyphenylpyruvate dioxygenase [Hasllibacter halocynthiae]|uniref:4-hydroxyphenylpyruvate dioxygenase n=1 Tax=Hasllibacter halocynthiae TaxID=595589 RepID=A0A2T0X737_9RHOB|nr:4-hydroxyphenylpyruvate dioxygenase [Hasllibacter halocynthiae]PRY94760.1 4-hydroxyphenylpyruvate dioxygenase [Hasllibacter halocynthiae]